MAFISKTREEELWQMFDTWTRGWSTNKLKNVFISENLEEFHKFLFFLESKVDWFDWKNIDDIKSIVSNYVFIQDFLINNNSNKKR